MATDNTFGAAGTDLSQLPQGALGALGGSGTLQTAYTLADMMTPKAQKFDPALAALLYFTEMGKQASQPGATLLGSVVGSGQAPAAYMMKQAEAAREREAGIGKTAVQLASVLAKDPAPTDTYRLTADILPLGKKAGDIVRLDARRMAALPEADQNSLVAYKAPGDGTSTERDRQRLIALGPKIANGTATPEEVQEYSLVYQDLSRGTRYTQFVDGREQEVTQPGINLASMPGLPVPLGFDPNKVLSDTGIKFDKNQIDGARFGVRMLQNGGPIQQVLDEGYTVSTEDVKKIRILGALGLGTLDLNPQAQRFYAAANNWIAAQLRQESGAAINPSEYADALEQYFPQAGDKPQVIEDKAVLRETATRGMINSAGDAFATLFPDAVPFITRTVKDEDGKEQVVEILNPVGWYELQRARVRQGNAIDFENSLQGMTLDEVKSLLAFPPKVLDERYTPEKQDQIAKVIEQKVNEAKQ
jgi:hypothetical protein